MNARFRSPVCPPESLRRVLCRVAVVAVALLLAFGSVLDASAARQGDEARPSPAQDGAQVIAQGISPIPNGEVVWRIVEERATGDGAEIDASGPGFVLSAADGLMVTNTETEARSLLAGGEAVFAPDGQTIEVAALDDQADFLRIGLVPAEEAERGRGVTAAGEPFDAPEGDRDIDLVRATLREDQEIALDLGDDDAPALLLVTDGAVDLIPAGSANATELETGDGADVAGEISLRAGDDGATVIVAVVGAEVSASRPARQPSTPGASAGSERGTLVVETLSCPAELASSDYAGACVDPVADIDVRLSISGTEFTRFGATDGDGATTFADLKARSYVVSAGIPDGIPVATIGCVDEDGEVETGNTGTDTLGIVVAVTSSDTVTCTWYLLPLPDGVGSGGTIALAVLLCPAFASPLDDCESGDITAPLTLTGPLTLSTSGGDVPVEIQGPNYVWGQEAGIPFGSYFLIVDMPSPDGYTLNRVEGSLGGSDIGYGIVVDEATPNPQVYLVYAVDPAGADWGYDGVDTNCGDFATFDDVQTYFSNDGGGATRNVDNLDANANGIACEPDDDGDAPYVPDAPPAEPAFDPGNDGIDTACGEFATFSDVQAYFAADGGSSERNVDGLDANRNGIACEPGDEDAG